MDLDHGIEDHTSRLEAKKGLLAMRVDLLELDYINSIERTKKFLTTNWIWFHGFFTRSPVSGTNLVRM